MTFTIDRQRTKLGFSVKHMMIATVRGSFSNVEADLHLDPDDLAQSRVTAKIEVASVDTKDRLRDEYLLGEHFFNPARFPHIEFSSTQVRIRGNKIAVQGKLSIRDQTRPISLEGTFRRQAPGTTSERLSFDLVAEVDRESYGLVFNGAVETVSVVVGKKVKLDLNIELVRA